MWELRRTKKKKFLSELFFRKRQHFNVVFSWWCSRIFRRKALLDFVADRQFFIHPLLNNRRIFRRKRKKKSFFHSYLFHQSNALQDTRRLASVCAESRWWDKEKLWISTSEKAPRRESKCEFASWEKLRRKRCKSWFLHFLAELDFSRIL